MLLWLLACTTPSPVHPEVPSYDLPPGLAAAPVPQLSVGPLTTGTVELAVHSLLPGEVAYFGLAKHKGAGPCPPAFLGACLSIKNPQHLGSATADASGTARLTANITPPVGSTTLWAQAVVLDLFGGATATTVVPRTVFDPALIHTGDAVITTPGDAASLVGIQAITGDLLVENTALTSLSLPDLKHIGGELRVWENPSLQTLDLPALRWVGEDLSLFDDNGLTSLAGLGGLVQVGGTLSINRMGGLTDLAGLEGLRSAGRLYLMHDVALSTLSGLDGLEEVGTAIDLWELYALQSASLPALTQVGGRLDLFDDDTLTSLDFPALHTLTGLEIHECDLLTAAGSYPLLTELPGAITLKYSPALKDLSGLAGVHTMGSLSVQRVHALADLNDLSGLTTVNGKLELSHNNSLVDVGLPSLLTLGRLSVDTNPLLVDVGLDNLISLPGPASVYDNPLLSQCALDVLFDRVQPSPVTCGRNLEDGCAGWCAVDTGP